MQRRIPLILLTIVVAIAACWIALSGRLTPTPNQQKVATIPIAPSSSTALSPTPGATVQTVAPTPSKDPSAWITDKDIEQIDFEHLPDDTGLVTPLVADLDNLDDDARKRLTEWAIKLNDWPGAIDENTPQRVRNLMSICALADLARAEFEGELAWVVFEKLKSEVDKDQLIKAAAWIVLKPMEGKAPAKAPELGWEDELEEEMIRERASLYAQKLLGRLMGKLPRKDQ